MNDDLTLLASAYLDGDVDDVERARVEADPELLAEVERLRSVQMLLGDTEPSPISTREELLANALDAWDRLPESERFRDATPVGAVRDPAAAGAATITAPTSLADRRRVNSNRRMLAAAAAITIVLGGGIAAQVLVGGSGDDDDSATVADVRSLADEAGDSADADTSAEAELSQEPTGGADDGAESTQLDTGINNPAPPGETTLVRLSSPDDLALFASDAIGAPQAPDVPAATSAPAEDLFSATEEAIVEFELRLCLGADFVVGPALYGDVEVVVAVDEGRSLVLAYQPASCTEVARARLP
jgi:hypothetical protein